MNIIVEYDGMVQVSTGTSVWVDRYVKARTGLKTCSVA
jgi:hypothetical protein